MRCTPTQKNPRVSWIFAALLIVGGIAYGIPVVCEARGISVMPIPFTFTAFLCVIAAVFVLVRYRMVTMVYLIRPRSDVGENGMETAFAGDFDISRMPPEHLDFIVIKGQGSRPGAMECMLSLGDLAAVYRVTKSGGNGTVTRQAVREKYLADGFVFYDYTLTLGLTEALELVFIDGNRYCGVIIEADEVMTRYLTELKGR
ncbi:MAG: hypothetical protein IJX93_04570 [Clostridia bacterium]|nr:hypothetical protein [Clostridia bacterium]MBQ8333027.1 hypothetical protein [Clostridia bacterium]MBQ8368747.1 hypothetical protein [Clostridia bacterium]MBQ8513273.1 hypothetical protein [Clostridia bacterium]